MKGRLPSIERLNSLIEQEKRVLKKKQRLLKIKLFVNLVMPAVLALLAVQVLKAFLQIKHKELYSGMAKQTERKTGETVTTVRTRPEFVTTECIHTAKDGCQ